MSLFLPIFGGFVFGIIAYFLIPLVVGAVAPSRMAGVQKHYISTAMGLLGRALLIKRKHGGYWLKKSSFDATFGKEKTTINGETKHFEDPENVMSRLHGWPFSLAHERSQTLINARLAELGETLRDRAREGKLIYEDGGDEYVNGYVRIADDDTRLVNLDHALPLMSGDAEPGTTDWSVEITKKSQHPFKSGNVVDYIGGLAAFGACFGAFWLASELLGSSGGGGRTLGIGMVDLLGVVL